jgi:hypothetical protein
MKAEFKACEWTGNESVDGYTPHVSIAKEYITGDQSFKSLDYIEFAVYNTGEEFTLTVDVEAKDGSRTRTKPYASYRLKAGWNVIRLTGFAQFGWVVNGTDLMDKISALRFGVPRDDKDRTLYFDNVYCAYVNE